MIHCFTPNRNLFNLQASAEQWAAIVKVLKLVRFEDRTMVCFDDHIAVVLAPPLSWTSEVKRPEAKQEEEELEEETTKECPLEAGTLVAIPKPRPSGDDSPFRWPPLGSPTPEGGSGFRWTCPDIDFEMATPP